MTTGCSSGPDVVDSSDVRTSMISATFKLEDLSDGNYLAHVTLRESWEEDDDTQPTAFLELDGGDELRLTYGDTDVPLMPVIEDHGLRLHYVANFQAPVDLEAVEFVFQRATETLTSSVEIRKLEIVSPSDTGSVPIDPGFLIQTNSPHKMLDVSGPCIEPMHIQWILSTTHFFMTPPASATDGCELTIETQASNDGEISAAFHAETSQIRSYTTRKVTVTLSDH